MVKLAGQSHTNPTSKVLISYTSQKICLQYRLQSSDPQWSGKGDIEKLLDLLLTYNYTSTGQRFLEDSWLNVNESDPMLYAVKTRMVEFMTELESGEVNVNSTIDLVSVGEFYSAQSYCITVN